MRCFTVVVIFSFFIACYPKLYIAQDPRQPQIVGSVWKWYTDDSVYLVNGYPNYLTRVAADTCAETYFFDTGGPFFTRRDSCGLHAAAIYYGTWVWLQGDSLTIKSSGAEPTFKSFRFTGDTLQLFRNNQPATDSFNGRPVNFVRTYIKG